MVRPEETVEVRADASAYVSRGGEKLAAALAVFGVDPAGRPALDVGASTGGFTDCLLRRGAARVYAVDVGYGQLAWGLRGDPRVTVLERTNARNMTGALFPVPPTLATVDVSFISLDKVLPVLGQVLGQPGEVVALIKPQFEAGRGKVGKGGVVRDRAVHREVLGRVVTAARAGGFACLGLTHSPLKGPAGNIEYFIHLQFQASAGPGGAAPPLNPSIAPDRTVEEAWTVLG